jgi:hypothetical protein
MGTRNKLSADWPGIWVQQCSRCYRARSDGKWDYPPMRSSFQTINNTDPGLQYAGKGWSYQPGRPSSVNNVQNDVHATHARGNSVAYTFTGTGVSYISEKSDGYGQVNVYLDGVFKQTANANVPGAHNLGGQVLFTRHGLPVGQHEIKLVKRNGIYMLLDVFIIERASTRPTNLQASVFNDGNLRDQSSSQGKVLDRILAGETVQLLLRQVHGAAPGSAPTAFNIPSNRFACRTELQSRLVRTDRRALAPERKMDNTTRFGSCASETATLATDCAHTKCNAEDTRWLR